MLGAKISIQNCFVANKKPAEIRVEQPTGFQLGVNLKTAKALGIAVTPTLPCPRRQGDRIATMSAVGTGSGHGSGRVHEIN
jgi:hypothetical protein